jgi:mannose-6-phosphate isomerase-like protein (cupin superfamily)
MDVVEDVKSRSERIIAELNRRYPQASAYALGDSATHFVSEIEPSKDHPEYDRAIEVILKSKPHKHNKMTQSYKVLSGTLALQVEDQVIHLKPGDTYVVKPGLVHSAESTDECWLEIYSEPGWTAEDHIVV